MGNITGQNNAHYTIWRSGSLILIAVLLAVLMVGTAGATTLTIYPIANGYAAETTDARYSVIRADSGDDSGNASTTTVSAPYLIATNTISDNMSKMSRGILTFDTSSIPDTATITAVTLHVYVSNRGVQLGTPNYGITGGAVAANNTIASGDYDGFTQVRYADDLSITAASRYWNWSLNAAGIANTSKTSYTTLFMRDSWDIDNSFGGTWIADNQSSITWRPVGYATENQRPYITVDYIYPLASGNYTFAHYSDPQLQTQDYPDALNATFDWIESNKDTYNITATIITGDLTEYGTNNTQWQTYTLAKSRTTVPTFETQGNHDDPTYFTNWTGHNPYWSQVYGNFIFIATPNLTVSNYNSDDAQSFITNAIISNSGKTPLIGTHSWLWNHGERTSTANLIIGNMTMPWLALSGHVENANGWNRTNNHYGSAYEALFDFQERTNTSDIVLYTVHVTGGSVDHIWRKTVHIYPSPAYIQEEAEVYTPLDTTQDLSQWNDDFSSLTNYGYYTDKYYEWTLDTANKRLYSNTTSDSYLYNRATFRGGNYTVIWEPTAYDIENTIYGGLMFGSSSSSSKGYNNAGTTQYTVTLSNQSGAYQMTLFRTLSGVATVLNHTHPATIDAGTAYTITTHWNPASTGTTITIYLDGVEQMISTDSAIKNGYAGPYVQQAGGTYFKQFSIQDVAPLADFTATPTSGTAPLSVQFTDASTSATTWNWSYSNQTGIWNVFSTSQNPSYTFAAGVYDINLSITNSLGTNTKTKTGYIASGTSGAYSVVVSETSVIGRYPNNTIIAQGTAGTDDGEVITGTIANATAGSTITFSGSFQTDGSINVTKNLNLNALGNATFLWNTGTDVTNPQFYIVGGGTGIHNVNTDTAIGATTLNVDSSSGIEVGDLVILYDSTIFNPLYSATWTKGEIHKVSSVGATTIGLTDPTVMSYNYATNASKILYISNPITVNMDGFYIYSTDASTNSHSAIYTKYLVDSTISNMVINATGQLGIGVYNGYNVTISGVTASNLEMSGQGYAVAVADASAFIDIKNSNFTTCRHTVTTGGTGTSPGGQPRDVTVDSNFLTGYLIAASQVLDAHPETFSMTITNNTIIHPYDNLRAYAVSLATKNLVFTNNTLITNGTAMRDRVSMANCSWIIQNNTFITPRYGYYVQRYGYSDVLFSNDYSTWDYVYFHDNTISGGGALITVEMPPTITLLDTDALVPLAELSMTDTNTSGSARIVSFVHTSFIKSDSRALNIRNATGNNTDLALPETSGSFSEPFHTGNWSVNLTATDEAGDNTSASFWVNVSEEAPIVVPTPTTTTSPHPFSSATGTSMIVTAMGIIGLAIIGFGVAIVVRALSSQSTDGLVAGILTIMLGGAILIISYMFLSPIMNLVA